MKNTFCLTEGGYAFLSQHIGDLENQETLEFFGESVHHFARVFNLRPQAVAHDLHPDYLSTRYALSYAGARALAAVAVQLHHAHIASCMAENGLSERVVGVAFDGAGYGADGAIWGGEFVIADYSGFQRVGHLKYVPLPGGEAAIRNPYRMALSYLTATYGQAVPPIDFLEGVDPAELAVIMRQIARGINSPPTSSCGRLCDAVSALLGIRGEISYEGQAAIELEMAAEEGVLPQKDAYRFGMGGNPEVYRRVPRRAVGPEPGSAPAKEEGGKGTFAIHGGLWHPHRLHLP